MLSHITLIFLPFSRIFSLNICQVRDSPNLFFFCAARKSLIWFHNYFKSDTAACLFSSRSEIYSKATIGRRPAVFSWIALFSVGFVNRSNCCLFNKLKKTLFQKAVKRHDLFTAKKWFLVHTTKAWRWGEAEHGIFRAFLVRTLCIESNHILRKLFWLFTCEKGVDYCLKRAFLSLRNISEQN